MSVVLCLVNTTKATSLQTTVKMYDPLPWLGGSYICRLRAVALDHPKPRKLMNQKKKRSRFFFFKIYLLIIINSSNLWTTKHSKWILCNKKYGNIVLSNFHLVILLFEADSCAHNIVNFNNNKSYSCIYVKALLLEFKFNFKL